MRAKPPAGWEEVFDGACIQAELRAAVLETDGLRPVVQRFSPMWGWTGSPFEDCRVYVPSEQAERARALLAEG